MNKQKEYDNLIKLFAIAESEAIRTAIINRMDALQDVNPLHVWCVWEDCIQLIYVDDRGEDDSPNGFAWDIQEYLIYPDNEVENYDAGVLWGYVSAVEAAQGQIGLYGKGKPKMYQADIQNPQLVVLCDYLSANYERLLSHIRTLPEYTGDYLKGLERA